MKRLSAFAIAFAVVLLIAFTTQASTINGITNQIISSFTAHGVLLGGGTGDIAVLAPSSTSGLPLLSQGSSADPAYATLANAGLTNSSITLNSAGCITAAGAVSLGGNITLTNTCTGYAGVTNATAGATPTWTLANGDAAWTLTANAAATVVVATGDKWAPHSIQICQDGTGSRTFTWPANVKGGMTVGSTASKCSMQLFESYDGTNLYAVGTGVINQ